MATTKTYTTKGAGTLEIRPMLSARVSEAGRQLKRDGVETSLGKADLESSPAVAAEFARVCLVRWTLEDGTEPLAGLKPKQQRDRLSEEAGLIDFIVSKAREIETEEAARFEVTSGN